LFRWLREMTAAVRIIGRVGGWILTAVILTLSFLHANVAAGHPHYFEHFAIFCATGITFGVGFGGSRRLVSMALVALAGAVELGQLFVPDRRLHASACYRRGRGLGSDKSSTYAAVELTPLDRTRGGFRLGADIVPR